MTGMQLTELIPDTLTRADIATPEGRRWLAALYAPPAGPFVRLNMITSLTGSATGADGTSDTLSSRIDRTVLGCIRATADVVVVGAQSVRVEGYVVPRRTRLAIVTSSGRFDGLTLAREGQDTPDADRVFLVAPIEVEQTVRATAERLGARVLLLPASAPLSPPDILAALADEGCTRVVCEGGPSLATQFAAHDVIDEYCVTVAPRLEPASAPFVGIDDAHRPDTAVAGLLVDGAGFSYLRLGRRGPARAPRAIR